MRSIAGVLLAVVTSTVATSVRLPASTTVSQAQTLVDSGLFAYYAYDRSAAIADFLAAAKADPRLAMAYWGLALANGPDLNTTISAADYGLAQSAVKRAVALENGATPPERALIDAMALRYGGSYDDADRGNDAYVAAMLAYAKSSNDDNAALLAAEALLERDGASRTAKMLVESVLARDPANPMANHLCVHVYDGATDRSPALPCAQRLDATAFAPPAEHLAHMPAHYWIETGDYAKAMASAERAYALLERLGSSDQTEQYGAHDAGVGYSAAMMLGSYQAASIWGQRMQDVASDGFDALTALRFARYERALGHDSDVSALAALRLGKVDTARAFAQQARGEAAKSATGYLPQLFLARLAEADGKRDEALQWLEDARKSQQAAYGAENIPLFPAGEAIGGFYLRGGEYAQAADAFQRTLDAYPNDPRALFGLSLALQALGRGSEADAARTGFSKVWAGSDTTLTANDL